jgi:putative ABC transport system ATP-binding protein
LLADEPTGNLDEENAKNVMDILKKLHEETQNTIVLITHDMQVAEYADKIYTLEDKQLILKK